MKRMSLIRNSIVRILLCYLSIIELFEECFGFKLNQGATTESRESIHYEQETDEAPQPVEKHLSSNN